MDFIEQNINEGKYENKVPYPSGKYVEPDFKVQREAYRIGQVKAVELFKTDLMRDFGLSNHKKANAIFDYAWAKGHSSGYREVYNVMIELAPLFQD